MLAAGCWLLATLFHSSRLFTLKALQEVVVARLTELAGSGDEELQRMKTWVYVKLSVIRRKACGNERKSVRSKGIILWVCYNKILEIAFLISF